jgi:chorismate synthase
VLRQVRLLKSIWQKKFGIDIRGHVTQIGNEIAEKLDWAEVPNNPFFCGDVDAVPRFEQLVTALREQGTSCGAKLKLLLKKYPSVGVNLYLIVSMQILLTL